MCAGSYRNFIRLCRDWPLDLEKKGRDLGAFLRESVVKAFKQGEASKVDAKECDAMYDSLQRIHTNYHKERYPITSVTGAIGISVEECSVITSTAGMNYLQEDDSWFQKLKKTFNKGR